MPKLLLKTKGCLFVQAAFLILEVFLFRLTFLVQELALESCFLLVKSSRRFFKIFTLLVFADNASESSTMIVAILYSPPSSGGSV